MASTSSNPLAVVVLALSNGDFFPTAIPDDLIIAAGQTSSTIHIGPMNSTSTASNAPMSISSSLVYLRSATALSNSLAVSGNASYAGSNSFTGPSTFSNLVTVTGNTLYAGSNSFTGPSTFSNLVTLAGNTFYAGSNSFTGPSTFSNAVTVTGNTLYTGSNIFTGSCIFSNAFTTSGNTLHVGNFTFTGPCTFNNKMTANGNSIFVGLSTFSNDVTISGNTLCVGSNLFTGPSTFSNDVTISGNTLCVGSNLFKGPSTFSNDMTISGNTLCVGSNLFTGPSTFSNDVTITGNALFGSSNTFAGPSTFSNDVTISGNVLCVGSNTFVGHSTFSNDITVSSNMIVEGVITCDSLNQTSDRRLKIGRHDITDALPILERLTPQTYTKMPNNAIESGFIAQDVWESVPELRHLISSADPNNFTLNMNYIGLIAYLVRAVQELDIRTRTLDLEHMRSLDSLAQVRTQADELTQEMATLKASLDAKEALPPSSLSDADFSELKDGWYRYDKMNTRLTELRSKGDESSYFLSTGNILFNYYDIIDNKNDSLPSIVMDASSAIPKTRRGGSGGNGGSGGGGGSSFNKGGDGGPSSSFSSSSSRSVISYFTGAASAAAAAYSASAASAASSGPKASTSTSASASTSDAKEAKEVAKEVAKAKPELKRIVEDRASLFDKYMQRISCTSAASSVHDECPHCGSDHRTLQPQDGYIYCNSCNTIEYVLVDHEKPAYKDPPKEVTHFAYKRINHLNEWLNQVQGKETTDIPEEVYDRILLEVKKQKINNMATLTRKSVKEILKKLKINKYYEHTAHIINRLNGIPMPQLPPNLEDRVRQMFCQIQVPFLKHAPPHRKNFLSYSYCLNKMMQLLEEDQYLDSFPLLKSREKLHQQDVIWQKICADLGWDFIPSL